MKLLLSNSTPTNASYTLESGQIIYRVTTPFKLKNSLSTIERVVPNDDADDMRDVFDELATIQWKIIESSIITTRGTSREVKEVFRKVRTGWFGRNMAFKAPDGLEYCWKPRPFGLKLFLNDGSDTLIAKSKQSNVFKSHQGYLDILPGGEHIADSILVTFVYIEKLRQRERQSQ
ncbi:hypothetical protein HGRIS_010724 [Hohenbuehelia grisea]|uniref:DUF6593 domain-containing protein n=1 Tax=Hohenbuehelia grisea TaxID=104357 RepID=A0ABR3IXL0_9AGAR